MHAIIITNIDLIINGRNDGSVTHEVLDADKDMDSSDMLAAADRTSLPEDDCCLMGYRTLEDLKNVSEVQVDEKIIPAIADLDIPLVLGCRWGTREDLENLSEAQVEDKIVPAITDLGIPLGMGS